MFIKRYKVLFALLIVLLVFLIAITIVCITASITPLKTNVENGKCFSISFDKQKMKTVNNVKITDEDKCVEITSHATIDAIVKETMVATHIGTGCSYERRIDLYCDDTLIRTMYWSSCCDSVCIYDTDASHWVFSIEGTRPRGYIYLSEELIAELNKLLA